MKKIFPLTDPVKHKDRVLESIKHEIRKYIKREKKKQLPNKATMYWDFDCKIGETKESSVTVQEADLIKSLDALGATSTEIVYIEILSKPVTKPLKTSKQMPEAVADDSSAD